VFRAHIIIVNVCAAGLWLLQAALDQRARLEELRKGARAQFALVSAAPGTWHTAL